MKITRHSTSPVKRLIPGPVSIGIDSETSQAFNKKKTVQ